MFKILSWFIGLIFLIIIGYYLWNYGGSFISNSATWFSQANQGNQNMFQQMQNPNSMFVDNSASSTVPSFLDKWFPGIFPLFKIGPDNYSSTGNDFNNLNPNVQSSGPTFENDYIEETHTNSYEVNINEGSIKQVIKEVNFAQ
jgi:hypothetical protein